MQENGHKETEQIKVRLHNMGTVNKNAVTIEKGGRQVSLYFSYETLVAVDSIVSTNDWSMTTGKLLNELEPNKKHRFPHGTILKEAQIRIKKVLYGDGQ